MWKCVRRLSHPYISHGKTRFLRGLAKKRIKIYEGNIIIENNLMKVISRISI